MSAKCTRYRLLAVSVLALAASLTTAEAANRRIVGQIVDQDGKPVPSVAIHVTSPRQENFSKDVKTDDKGKFVVVVMEGIDQLLLDLTKEGFLERQEAVQASLSGAQVQFTLQREQGPFSGSEGTAAKSAFERGVAAARAADWPEARKAFQEVVAAQPDLSEGWFNLATVEYNLKAYEPAIAAAKKALELKPDLAPANKVLADSYSMLGKDEQAATFKAKVAEADPLVAAELAFNEAAALANAGKDAEARLLFEKALAANPDLADAHYELGLCLFRLKEGEAARVHFERFIELAPAKSTVAIARTLIAELDKAKHP